MRLSTSSSNDRLPDGSWARIWVLALALLIAGLAAREIVLRTQGHVASVRDSARLWVQARAQVRMDDPNEVVLIGSSRIHLAIDLDVFEREFGHRAVQLAAGGSFADPVLKDLADSGFAGTVIYSMTPYRFRITNDGTTGRQANYVRAYQTRHFDAGIEQTLRNLVEGSLVSLPSPDYIQTLPTRQRRADYQRTDLEEARAHRWRNTNRKASLPPWDAIQQELDRMERWIEQIQSRGGRVVIIRLPSSGRILDFERTQFPREQYWDRMAAQTQAIAINFDDEPLLRGFECPEGSHLDFRDAERFTQALARVLRTHLSD